MHCTAALERCGAANLAHQPTVVAFGFIPQAGKVTAPSSPAPGKLLVLGNIAGLSCLTTASRWSNDHCGQHGWSLSDLLVGVTKRAKLQSVLRLLCERPLMDCRPPLYDVMPARVLADVSASWAGVGAAVHVRTICRRESCSKA